MTIKDRKFTSVVKLIVGGDEKHLKFAAKNINPFITYISFVLTDDQPNKNGDRVPLEEFGNVVATGLYMPIKVSEGIIEGHADATPLGTIISLNIVENRIEGVAVLWDLERPADMALARDRFESGDLQLSWELAFTEDDWNDELACYDLSGCILRGATIVDDPAYGGRTPVKEMSAELDDEEGRENDSEEEMTKEELEQMVTDLESDKGELETRVTVLTDANVALKDSQVTEEMTSELETLREFKRLADEDEQRIARMAEIKAKFEEEEVVLPENYLEENSEVLLGMDEKTLAFTVSAFKTLNEKVAEDKSLEDEELGDTVPHIDGKETSGASPKSIAQAMKDRGEEK